MFYQQGGKKINAQISLGNVIADIVFNWAIGKRRLPYFWQDLKEAFQILDI